MQSSPWQRDHFWKQTCPSRNISTEMNFYFWRPKKQRSDKMSKKRRAPYSNAPEFEKIHYRCEDTFGKIKKEFGKRSLMVIVQTLIDKNFQTR